MVDEACPLVSVVIPVFNSEKTIGDTLRTVLSQDYTNLEIIVIDDGSTDNTKKILEKYGSKIHVIEQSNSGSAIARNKGVKNAKGKYIAFIDADDSWVSWKISTQVKYLETNKDIGMIYNSWIVIHDIDDMLPEFRPEQSVLEEVEEKNSGWIYTKLLLECIVHTSAVVILKSLCEEIGEFDSELRRGQDYDYWLRASQLTKIIKLKSTLSAYHIHSDNITTKAPDKNYEAILLNKAIDRHGICDLVGNSIDPRLFKIRLAESWKNFTWKTYNTGNYHSSFKGGIEIIKLRPFWYLGWGYLLASFIKSNFYHESVN